MALVGGAALQLSSSIVAVSQGASAGTMCNTAPTGPMSTPVLDSEWAPRPEREVGWNGTDNPSHESQIQEHEDRKEPSRSSSEIYALLPLNKNRLYYFKNVRFLLEYLQ